MEINKDRLLAIRNICMELVRSIDGAITAAESSPKSNVDDTGVANVVDDDSDFVFEVAVSHLDLFDSFRTDSNPGFTFTVQDEMTLGVVNAFNSAIGHKLFQAHEKVKVQKKTAYRE